MCDIQPLAEETDCRRIMSDEKRERGRPATGKTPPRQLGRMSDEDYETICRAAELLGQSKTAFMAETLLRRAKLVIRKYAQRQR